MSSLPRNSGLSSMVGMKFSSAVCRPGTKCSASFKFIELSSMNSTLSGRNCTASISAWMRGPLGSQSMLGKMKYSQMPVSSRIARTGVKSFFEQIELMMPRRASAMTMSCADWL